MPEIDITCTPHFDQDADHLRLLCFPPAAPVDSSRDVFDTRSLHVRICIDTKLAACARLTAGPQSVIETWTAGAANVPTGPHVADYSRGCVAPSHRGLGLFRLLSVESLLLAAASGFTHVVGALIPGEKHAHTLYSLGFQNSGSLVQGHDSVGQSALVQPLVVSCSNAHHWKQFKSELQSQLNQSGYKFALE
jgi:hypothetical protein